MVRSTYIQAFTATVMTLLALGFGAVLGAHIGAAVLIGFTVTSWILHLRATS